MRTKLIAIALMTCLSQAYGQSREWKLTEGWKFRQEKTTQWYPATVPGVVQQDLIQLGLAKDPFYGTQEKDIQWVEDENWEYKTTFPIPTDTSFENFTLQFEGLDTYASVWLNGEKILEADNMFRQWKVSVKQLLRAENELRIRFRSPIVEHQPDLEGLPYHKTAGNDTREDGRVSVYARKAPFQFGWDWAPRVVTVGPWKDISLVGWNSFRFTGFHLFQNQVTEAYVSGKAEIRYDGVLPKGTNIRIVDEQTDSTWLSYTSSYDRTTTEEFPYRFEAVDLWYPHTIGRPTLYSIRVELWQGNTLIGQQHQQVGFRKVELIQEPDDSGTSFAFEVNGIPFFALGANMVPPDPMVTRVGDTPWETLAYDAHAVGMNMIRAWGGGIYPPEAFYQACDSLGILVWQDFMFACSMYPAGDGFLKNVQAEAIQQIERLQTHPSLAIWCGNNEVDVAWHNWGWQFQHNIHGEDSAIMAAGYDKIFKSLLPQLIQVLDPNRPFVHTSPLSNWGKLENFNHSSMHYWGVWHGGDPLEAYQKFVPRFMSEYGFQSFPESSTVALFADSSQWSLESPVMQHHQKSYIGNGEIRRHLQKYYPKARDFADFAYKSQLTQRIALDLAITSHRKQPQHCRGTIYWQLNDTWPGPSWSTRDYYGKWKAAHYALKSLYAPLMVSGEFQQGILTLFAHESRPRGSNFQVQVTKVPMTGVAELVLDKSIFIAPHSDRKIITDINLPTFGKRKAVYQVAWFQENEKLGEYWVYPVAPKKLNIRRAVVQIKLLANQSVELLSETFVPDVFLEANHVLWSENFINLIPGKPKIVKYEGEISNVQQIQWMTWAE